MAAAGAASETLRLLLYDGTKKGDPTEFASWCAVVKAVTYSKFKRDGINVLMLDVQEDRLDGDAQCDVYALIQQMLRGDASRIVEAIPFGQGRQAWIALHNEYNHTTVTDRPLIVYKTMGLNITYENATQFKNALTSQLEQLRICGVIGQQGEPVIHGVPVKLLRLMVLNAVPDHLADFVKSELLPGAENNSLADTLLNLTKSETASAAREQVVAANGTATALVAMGVKPRHTAKERPTCTVKGCGKRHLTSECWIKFPEKKAAAQALQQKKREEYKASKKGEKSHVALVEPAGIFRFSTYPEKEINEQIYVLNTMVEQPIYLGAPESYSWNSCDNQPQIIASRFYDTAMFTVEDDDDETGLSQLLNLYNSTSTADLDIVHCHMSFVQQETDDFITPVQSESGVLNAPILDINFTDRSIGPVSTAPMRDLSVSRSDVTLPALPAPGSPFVCSIITNMAATIASTAITMGVKGATEYYQHKQQLSMLFDPIVSQQQRLQANLEFGTITFNHSPIRVVFPSTDIKSVTVCNMFNNWRKTQLTVTDKDTTGYNVSKEYLSAPINRYVPHNKDYPHAEYYTRAREMTPEEARQEVLNAASLASGKTVWPLYMVRGFKSTQELAAEDEAEQKEKLQLVLERQTQMFTEYIKKINTKPCRQCGQLGHPAWGRSCPNTPYRFQILGNYATPIDFKPYHRQFARDMEPELQFIPTEQGWVRPIVVEYYLYQQSERTNFSFIEDPEFCISWNNSAGSDHLTMIIHPTDRNDPLKYEPYPTICFRRACVICGRDKPPVSNLRLCTECLLSPQSYASLCRYGLIPYKPEHATASWDKYDRRCNYSGVMCDIDPETLPPTPLMQAYRTAHPDERPIRRTMEGRRYKEYCLTPILVPTMSTKSGRKSKARTARALGSVVPPQVIPDGLLSGQLITGQLITIFNYGSSELEQPATVAKPLGHNDRSFVMALTDDSSPDASMDYSQLDTDGRCAKAPRVCGSFSIVSPTSMVPVAPIDRSVTQSVIVRSIGATQSVSLLDSPTQTIKSNTSMLATVWQSVTNTAPRPLTLQEDASQLGHVNEDLSDVVWDRPVVDQGTNTDPPTRYFNTLSTQTSCDHPHQYCIKGNKWNVTNGHWEPMCTVQRPYECNHDNQYCRYGDVINTQTKEWTPACHYPPWNGNTCEHSAGICDHGWYDRNGKEIPGCKRQDGDVALEMDTLLDRPSSSTSTVSAISLISSSSGNSIPVQVVRSSTSTPAKALFVPVVSQSALQQGQITVTVPDTPSPVHSSPVVSPVLSGPTTSPVDNDLFLDASDISDYERAPIRIKEEDIPLDDLLSDSLFMFTVQSQLAVTDQSVIILDSGATNTICNQVRYMQNLVYYDLQDVPHIKTVTGELVPVTAKGDMVIKVMAIRSETNMSATLELVFPNTIFAPTLQSTIAAVTTLCYHDGDATRPTGNHVLFGGPQSKLVLDNGWTIPLHLLKTNLFYMTTVSAE